MTGPYWKRTITCMRAIPETPDMVTFDFQRKEDDGAWTDHRTNTTSSAKGSREETPYMVVQYRCRFRRPGFTSQWSEPAYINVPRMIDFELPGPTTATVSAGQDTAFVLFDPAPEYLVLESNSIQMIYSTNKGSIEV